ncbi:MAG: outer membrane beta-barrel protein [Saprospiraceae bacterium]|nr:outer membrane beta-barrel protein [Saprospiraceae bacterium]
MSDQDKRTEEIKALLRKKLEGLPPAEDGWNVPSQAVWGGLSEELKGKKEQQKPFNRGWAARLATIIAALLVILFWRECSNQRQLTKLKTEVEKVSEAFQELKETCSEKQTTVKPAVLKSESGSETGSNDTPDQQGKFLPTEPNQRSISKPSNPSFFQKKQPQHQQFQEENKATSNIQQQQPNQSMSINETGLMPNEPTGTLKLINPEMVDYLNISTLKTLQSLPILRLNLPNPNAHNSTTAMLIASLYGGLALTGNQLSGQKPAIIQDQKALLTWRTGLGLELPFSKNWSVITGVDFNHSRIETAYNLAVPYTHNGEFQHDDGNYDNQYNHSLPSALGNYPAQFVLTRESSSQVNEGEVMELELTIRQKTQFLSFPLQLRYALGNQRWQLGARTGVFANHVLGIQSEKPNLVSNHSAIHERHTSIGAPPLTDLQKWTFDVTLGLDLRYQLSSKLGLSATSSFQRGVTPVYEDEFVKSHLHAWNLGLGLHYFLR